MQRGDRRVFVRSGNCFNEDGGESRLGQLWSEERISLSVQSSNTYC